jgi:hypothetical protein
MKGAIFVVIAKVVGIIVVVGVPYKFFMGLIKKRK